MRKVLPVVMFLMLLAAPAHATTAEAEALAKAVTAINTSAQAMNAGTSTPDAQVDAMALILEGIGAVEDYTTACQPLARYVLLLAESWHGALVAIAAKEPAAIRGYLLISTALFGYYGNPQGFVPVVINECAAGL